ncbi:MAG: DNA-3-methyladenine glycosylase I [Ignavibacteria bacterium]|nr:DNA-3-methyladenine glycosylase I [Ignavibacteria bacterium]
MKNNKIRCSWSVNDRLMTEYHDKEWGVPLHDDHKLFEYIILDAFQAGLSWRTILYKRDNFRKAFDNFQPEKIAVYTEKKTERLLNNEKIIRNRLKIKAAITNAKAFLKIKEEFGSFNKYIWQFTGYKTIHNKWHEIKQLPSKSNESDLMSIDLKKRGFKFAGSTICYAFMQASGMINDHLISCYRYKEIKKL